MCKIVETKKQFEGFLQLYENSDVILQPILTHHKLHPKNNELCAVFVRIIDVYTHVQWNPLNQLDPRLSHWGVA